MNELVGEDKSVSLTLANIHSLKGLTPGDTININLGKDASNANVVDVVKGQHGTQSIFLENEDADIPLTSLITISQTSVFMSLATTEVDVMASGNHQMVTLSQATLPQHDKPDYIIPDIYAEFGKPRSQTKKQRTNRQQPSKASNNIQDSTSTHVKAVPSPSSNAWFDNDEKVVDLLMVYTTDTLSDMKNDPQGFFDHQVNWLNFALSASDIDLRVNLVATMEIDADFDFMPSVLEAVREGYPPFENVALERSRYGADVVMTFMQADLSLGLAGLAYSPNAFFKSYDLMYGVTSSNVNVDVFAHEMGHIFGLGHSQQQGNYGNPFSYGRGFRMESPDKKGFTTIMGYDTTYARVVPRFANPDKLCGVTACGLPRTDITLSGSPWDFDNDASDATSAVNNVRDNLVSTAPRNPEQTSIDDALSQITDTVLKKCISDQVNRRGDVTLTSQISSVDCFTWGDDSVLSLEGIAAFDSLNYLEIANSQISDLSPLAPLTVLKGLYISNKSNSDVAIEQGLDVLHHKRSLKYLSLINTGLTDSAVSQILSGIDSLFTLSLRNNQLTRVPDLSRYQYLSNLYLVDNPITDASSLKVVKGLKELDVSNTKISTLTSDTWSLPSLTSLRINDTDISSLASLDVHFLQRLEARNTPIKSISALPDSSWLSHLDMSGSDVSSLATTSRFKRLAELYLNNTPLSSFTGLSNLPYLTRIFADNTGLSSLDFLSGTANLTWLYANNNALTDLSPLSNTPGLEVLHLSGNQELEINTLPTLSQLRELRVSHLDIENLDFLKPLGRLEQFWLSESTQLKDISGLFELPFLNDINTYYRSDFYDDRPYCWQLEYLRNASYRQWRNFKWYDDGKRCNTNDERNDYDEDGVPNADEIAQSTDPTNNENASVSLTLKSNEGQVYEGFGTVEYGLVRYGSIDEDVQLRIKTTDGTAVAENDDYQAIDDSFTLESGNRFYSISMLPYFDRDYSEPDEAYSFSIEDVQGSSVEIKGTNYATVTIKRHPEDDINELLESKSKFGFKTIKNAVVKEGEQVDITFHRLDDNSGSVQLDIYWMALTNGAERYFEDLPESIFFEDGQQSVTLTLSTLEVKELQETAYLSLRIKLPDLLFHEDANALVEADDRELVIVIQDKGQILDPLINARDKLYDFDGDGLADIGVRRASQSMWYVKNSQGLDPTSNFNDDVTRMEFGLREEDIPVPGFYDGDDRMDFAFRRPSTQTWYVRNSSGVDYISNNDDGISRIRFGFQAEDIPVPGDYDGDGRTDIAVRRPSTSTWYILNSRIDKITKNDDKVTRLVFGRRAEDIPVAADYDGDGRTDIAIRRPSTSTWYILNSTGVDNVTNNEDGITRIRFGLVIGDIPVPADYDGDGKADIAVRRPGTKMWYIRNSSGVDLITGHDDGISRFQFGMEEEDIPVPADYDGDGLADIAVRRPSSKMFYIRNSNGTDYMTGYDDGVTRIEFGMRETDIPLAAPDYLKSRSFNRWPGQARPSKKQDGSVLQEQWFNLPEQCSHHCESGNEVSLGKE
ncbi:hypothetical protein MACH26_25770 [Planctobacterium marinum]|uniref:Calx-beta domain-containing protein n=1 Tax=Planctobacterium marinum TaxID=1631968 RepID=A0AA48HIJ0_9ALTE|nr:hypothetical protein MACH26_25770 [Planctobacterium marinum]